MDILKLLVLILDILAIVQIVQGKADIGKKALWILIILLLPVLGFVLWYLLARKK